MALNNLSRQVRPASLIKAIIAGAVIGLLLISSFIITADDPDPQWGKYWFIRPLVIVPLAGGGGGAFFYFMMLQFGSGWQKFFAIIFSFLAFIIALWLGVVLGLDGTYWD